MARKDRPKEAKRKAVVAGLRRVMPDIEILSSMWDDRTLDTIILALGIGHVEIDDEGDRTNGRQQQ